MDGITVDELVTVWIVTCRPCLLNRPFSCAMYRPAAPSPGTAATIRSLFSGPADLVALAVLPQAATATAVPAIMSTASVWRKGRRPPRPPLVTLITLLSCYDEHKGRGAAGRRRDRIMEKNPRPDERGGLKWRRGSLKFGAAVRSACRRMIGRRRMGATVSEHLPQRHYVMGSHLKS